MNLYESTKSIYIRKVGVCTSTIKEKYILSISDKGEQFYFGYRKNINTLAFGDKVIIAKQRKEHNPNFITWDLHEVTIPRSRYSWNSFVNAKNRKIKKKYYDEFIKSTYIDFRNSYIVFFGKDKGKGELR